MYVSALVEGDGVSHRVTVGLDHANIERVTAVGAVPVGRLEAKGEDLIGKVLEQIEELEGPTGRLVRVELQSQTVDYHRASMRLARLAEEVSFQGIRGLNDLSLLPDDLCAHTILLKACNRQQAYDLTGQWPIDVSRLASLPRVRALLTHAERDIRCAAPVPHLESLRLSGLGTFAVGDLPPTEADLSFLEHFPGLRTLELTGTTPHSVAPIARLNMLEELSADGVQGLAEVCPASLRKLRWRFTELADLAPLSACGDLRSLEVRATQIRGAAAVAEIERLEKLSLIGEQGPGRLEHAGRWGQLTSLTLSGNGSALAHLGGAPGLTSLYIGGDAWTALPELAEPSLLSEVSVAGPVSDLSPLARCAELVELDLRNCTKGPSLAPLAELPRLERVVWSVSPQNKPKPDRIRPLEGNERVRIVYGSATKTWRVADLLDFLDGRTALPKLADAARTCAVLKARRPKKTGGGISHWGGCPDLASNEEWPLCEVCDAPMTLIVQLDLALHPEPPREGLLQFFYCLECAVMSPSYSPGVMHIRVLEPGSGRARAQPPPGSEPITENEIVGATAKKDKPTAEDFEILVGGLCSSSPRPNRNDKLGGWPDWVQSPEWPSCEECGDRMELLLQIASDKGLAHTWGDCGDAYLFVCWAHPTRFGFLEQSC